LRVNLCVGRGKKPRNMPEIRKKPCGTPSAKPLQSATFAGLKPTGTEEIVRTTLRHGERLPDNFLRPPLRWGKTIWDSAGKIAIIGQLCRDRCLQAGESAIILEEAAVILSGAKDLGCLVRTDEILRSAQNDGCPVRDFRYGCTMTRSLKIDRSFYP
jgi:hypothetical protein